MEKVIALYKITRPVNCMIGGLSILVAAIIASEINDFTPVWFAVVSGIFITAGANIINDWYDIEIDRINKANRPLPAGKLSPKTALIASIFSFICGIGFSIFISTLAVAITLLSTFILIVYSAVLKRTVLFGNIAVSFMTGLAFIYGAIAGGNVEGGIYPAGIAFFFHLGREMIKDMEDTTGDKKMGARTFPIIFGNARTIKMIQGIFLLLILVILLPYSQQVYSSRYLWTVIIGVFPILLWVALSLRRTSNKRQLNLYSNILKVDMVIGLFAIYIGKI